jgi:RNA polymerase sigma factor (sigma-70 family)
MNRHPIEERSDQEWIRALKAGKTEAVQDLWLLLFKYGCYYANYYQVSEDVGRDAAVESYQRVLKRGLEQYAFRCTFKGYCRVIVLNEVRRLLDPEEKDPLELDMEIVGSEAPPLPRAPTSEVMQRLKPCFSKLKTKEKEVINLRYLQELSPEKVAKQLGITRNYVNVLAYRARQKMLDCLKLRGYETLYDLL